LVKDKGHNGFKRFLSA